MHPQTRIGDRAHGELTVLVDDHQCSAGVHHLSATEAPIAPDLDSGVDVERHHERGSEVTAGTDQELAHSERDAEVEVHPAIEPFLLYRRAPIEPRQPEHPAATAIGGRHEQTVAR